MQAFTPNMILAMVASLAFFLCAVDAMPASTVAAAARSTVELPIYSNFSQYCYTIDWKGPSTDGVIRAECNMEGGQLLRGSHLALDNCFANDKGHMNARDKGFAMDSCTCAKSVSIDGCTFQTCSETLVECKCDDGEGGTVKNRFDLDEYFGLMVWDGQLVISCNFVNDGVLSVVVGTFDRCVQQGANVPDCPSYSG